MDTITRKTVLIVDDEVDLAEILEEVLKEHNFDVLKAVTGKDALNIIDSAGVPDLILLDMTMPEMDGWTFSNCFFDKYGRSCPIVVMTPRESSDTRAMEIGADTYLGKPFEMDTLIKTVKSMLS